ncbi:hypothetical protein AC579_2092 [Pseudocercospora musae]|uniref:RING-type domain-containing protein n=1 Tax=Pseudocercospora musae TaxID=113226 RepID=A0A139ID72_9PEZI|nr:hypothetical protein AC579_2092 [Pseudocercospora musae]
MDGGSASDGWPRLYRRESAKREFTMAEPSTRNASPDTLFVSDHDAHYTHPEHAPQRRRLSPPTLALPPRRHYPGDGYDFRTPVMSSASTSHNTQEPDYDTLVIDLTDEAEPAPASHASHSQPAQGEGSAGPFSARATRGPRFGRNIIDVESEGEEEGHSTRPSARAPPRNNYDSLFPRFSNQRPQPHQQFSVLRRPNRPTPPSINMDDFEDVEFLDSRPASQARHRPISRAPRSVTPYPNGQHEPIDLTGDDDDEVMHVESRVRPGLNLDRPAAVAGTRTRSIMDGFPDALAGLFGSAGGTTARLWNRWNEVTGGQPGPAGNHEHRNAAPRAHIHFGPPRVGMQMELNLGGMMDYDTPAFDMGYQGANRPPEPKYEPPKAAEKGFTRSPGEDEIVVCPNCGDELAMGDTEQKQQVWVIKKCGHAYCGTCAENRTKVAASRTKGKGKGKALDVGTFKVCVVDGCNAPASKNSMVHVYLGS